VFEIRKSIFLEHLQFQNELEKVFQLFEAKAGFYEELIEKHAAIARKNPQLSKAKREFDSIMAGKKKRQESYLGD